MAYLNHNLPTFTCFLRNEYLFNHEKGYNEYTLSDVRSVASMEKRVPLFKASCASFLSNVALTNVCIKSVSACLPQIWSKK